MKQSEIIKTNLKTLESPLLMCPQGSQAYRKMCLHPLKLNLEIRCARAVLLKETAKKSYNQETGLGYRGHLKALIWFQMIKEVTHAHSGLIWYHSEPSDVPNSPNQFLGLDFCFQFLTARRLLDRNKKMFWCKWKL